jgi:mono/diheme cytochrome c family protein
MARSGFRLASTLSLLLLAACVAGGDGDLPAGEIGTSTDPSTSMASTPQLLTEGQRAYEKHCLACHGEVGDGAGEAAYLLYPKPRDFTRGQYRLVSSWEGTPTDEDLFRAISRGMPGSAMPSWGHLPEATRWALVHYIKDFSTRPLEIAAPEDPAKQYAPGKGVIRVPQAPAFTPEGEKRARELYAQGCAACHGATGRGDGRREQVDSKGRPTRPRDLTAGVFKGSYEPEAVYRRIVAGLPGSPMPSSPYLYGDDAWHLTHLVLGMSSEEQREKVEMKKYRIVAKRADSIPTHPDDGAWGSVEPVQLQLMPLWWRDDRPEAVTVKAVHDGTELAILMVWSDPRFDHTVIRPQDFRDGAAVQLALAPDPPFFAMGDLKGGVNIWMWKSERQADLQPAYQDLDKVYPNIGIDSYPNFSRSPLEQPTRHALTLDSDPTYVTAWGVGNVVSNPTGDAVEDLSAQGFGTLRSRHGADSQVQAVGLWELGSYRVLFRRPLVDTTEGAAPIRGGRPVPIAFAVWDGSAGDRDGKKSVTIWQDLVIAP